MIDQSGAAMQAERVRAEVVAANMANAETTQTEDGTPYRRQSVIFTAGNAAKPESSAGWGDSGQQPFALQLANSLSGISGSGTDFAPGVRIAGVVQDASPPLKRYDPGHPDADADGFVSYPDINPLTEMTDLMGATRAYGLNASAVQAEKSMITAALELGK
jgi:flagellar basal-body rod protein FlgC